MRILFSGTPIPGHLFPMLPLLRAFRDRGDDVAVLAAAAAAPLLQPEGIELLAAGPTIEELVRELQQRMPDGSGVGVVTAESEAEASAGIVVDYGLDAALSAAREWKPDLIIGEYYDSLGKVVAAALDVPVATLGLGPALRPAVRDAIRNRLVPQYEKAGLTARPERWYLDTCPPSLQQDGWQPEGESLLLRPEPYGPSEAPAAQAEETSGRPKVLVSFGTMLSDPVVVKPYVEGLLGLDVDLRVTLGFTAQVEDYGITSDRVEFVGFTPMSQLLHGVDAVLTHGGSGTVLAALSQGLPMVVAPVGADQPVQAERVAAAGAGIAFPVGATPPAEVTKATATVLGASSYAATAQSIATEIAAMQSPRDIAERIAAALTS